MSTDVIMPQMGESIAEGTITRWLVKVGDKYFVLDGHHRISVAKALGQESIEAEVTVWDVAGPLPWERTTSHSAPALQAA